jgi:hypothetical protein
MGARDSLVVKSPRYRPEGRGFETRRGEWFLSIYLILPVALGPEVYSAYNRSDDPKQKYVYVEYSGGRRVRLKTYRHLWADCLNNVGSLTSDNSTGLHSVLRG